MSAKKAEAPPVKTKGPFVHYCRCGKWGAFGSKGKWFCAEHRPEKGG